MTAGQEQPGPEREHQHRKADDREVGRTPAVPATGGAAGGWHGRRAAYCSIIGFAMLVLTLGAGLFLPGRHGS